VQAIPFVRNGHFMLEVLTMFCESCGKQLKESAAFCPGCGEVTGAKSTSHVVPPGNVPATASPNISADLTKELKARSKDVWAGVKQLAVSPVGGLPASFQSFGEQRALWAAVGFTALYLLFLAISLYRAGQSLESLAGMAATPSGPFAAALATGASVNDFGWYMRLLLCGLVTIFTLSVAAMLMRLVFRGKGTFLGDFYIASASMLPVAVALFLISIIGVANVEVMLLLMVFAVVYNILMLYAGCSRISGISEAGAAPAVPIMLLVTLYLTKVAVAAILF
jgi:hypothetical protein